MTCLKISDKCFVLVWCELFDDGPIYSIVLLISPDNLFLSRIHYYAAPFSLIDSAAHVDFVNVPGIFIWRCPCHTG